MPGRLEQWIEAQAHEEERDTAPAAVITAQLRSPIDKRFGGMMIFSLGPPVVRGGGRFRRCFAGAHPEDCARGPRDLKVKPEISVVAEPAKP